MDSLLFPQPTPAPLILPRRASVHSRKGHHLSSADGNGNVSGNGRRGSPPGNSFDSSNHDSTNGSPSTDNHSRNPLTHYFYFPTTLYPPPQHSQKQPSPQQNHQPLASADGSNGSSSATATGAGTATATTINSTAPVSAEVATSIPTSTSLDTTQEDYLSSINMQRKPPAIFAFGNERGTTDASAAVEELSGFLYTPSLAPIRSQTHRRHSMGSYDRPYLRRSISGNGLGGSGSSSGAFNDLIQSIAESEEENEASSSPSSSLRSRILWTTIPPRHALHMPIMKINPEIWRSESHNREIYRLMHEARERQVMKRRNIKAVMDTLEDGEEDGRPEDGPDMADVVMTMDLGGWHALEEQEKEKVREQVMKEWKALVAREYMAMVQREQQQQLIREQQQQQQQQEARRKSWPVFTDPQQVTQYQHMQQFQREQHFLREQQQQQLLERQRLALSQTSAPPSYSLSQYQHHQPLSSEQLQRLQQMQLQQRLIQQQQQQQQYLQQMMHQKWMQQSSAPDAYGAVNRMPEHAPPPGLQQSSSSFAPAPSSQPRMLQVQTLNMLGQGGAGANYSPINGSWSAGTPNSGSLGIHPSWISNAPTGASFSEYRK
ncbi:hypothetical protein BGZ73_005404 [Actinomortierella ambigua]|nr:hypothetical protein BGZ73_005404 [Actinomortierella ambigua]